MIIYRDMFGKWSLISQIDLEGNFILSSISLYPHSPAVELPANTLIVVNLIENELFPLM